MFDDVLHRFLRRFTEHKRVSTFVQRCAAGKAVRAEIGAVAAAAAAVVTIDCGTLHDTV